MALSVVQVTLPAPFAPLAIGLAVVVGSFAAGPFTGGAMNPARALGPAIAFWNFKNIWVYILATFMGGMSGAVIYENLFLEVGLLCCRSVGRPHVPILVPCRARLLTFVA